MEKNLSEKAMLVSLNISTWNARREDKEATENVAATYGTDRDAGRYNKVLLQCPELDRIKKANNSARSFHYANTLPWTHKGADILPAENYFEYTREMDRLKREFQDAVIDLFAVYPQRIQEHANRLNNLFKPDDYPAPEKLAKKYSFSIFVSPLPAAPDFRVDLGDGEIKRIREELDTSLRQATAYAMRDLWQRLFDTVSHMAEKLSDPDAVIRETVITNLQDLINLLPRLNMTNDPALDTMRREIEQKILDGIDINSLRKAPLIRQQTAADAATLAGKIAALMDGPQAQPAPEQAPQAPAVAPEPPAPTPPPAVDMDNLLNKMAGYMA